MGEWERVAAADGGVITRRVLLSHGMPAHEIERSVRRREFLVLRRGWYAVPGADPAVVSAVRSGGVISCLSALDRAQGVWSVPSERTHVRRSRHFRSRLPGCSGYTQLATPFRAVDPIPEALACAARCASAEDFVAICDSILRERPGTTVEDLRRSVLDAPQRVLALLDYVETSADSGLESIVRFRLRRCGLRVRTQVHIDGVGYVDFLVGRRLIIECDGREHHLGRQFSRDRWRDLNSVAGGFVVMRLTYANVMHQWDEVYPLICEVIRSRRHLDRSAKLSR